MLLPPKARGPAEAGSDGRFQTTDQTYSKGMVQRLGLAQAMLHDPEVYILDEPMSGLDPLGRSLVKDIIRGFEKRRQDRVFQHPHNFRCRGGLRPRRGDSRWPSSVGRFCR